MNYLWRLREEHFRVHFLDDTNEKGIADRGGGGVNLNTTFTPVEGLTNVWERDVRLTNDVGECVSDLLTSDFNLRVIVRDSNLTMTVFQDFEAVP